MMQYGDIFVEVRQRVAAFKMWADFCRTKYSIPEYAKAKEGDYLDEAYRFLYTSASRDFIKYCARREKMRFNDYCANMGIDKKQLI